MKESFESMADSIWFQLSNQSSKDEFVKLFCIVAKRIKRQQLIHARGRIKVALQRKEVGISDAQLFAAYKILNQLR